MKTFSWKDPTTNADGSPIVGALRGFIVGVRSVSQSGGPAIQFQAASAKDAEAKLIALTDVLNPGTYTVAAKVDGAVQSAWSTETTFVVEAPVVPVPNPPTGLTVT